MTTFSTVTPPVFKIKKLVTYFSADYDTVNDENRGHLWYYFHDPSWPRNQFPKDIMATAVGKCCEFSSKFLNSIVGSKWISLRGSEEFEGNSVQIWG